MSNETLEQIVAEIRKAAQVERDRSWVGAPHGADEWKLDDWADRIERALPSLAELERDAGRYRWLRDRADMKFSGGLNGLKLAHSALGTKHHGPQWDERIDAAREMGAVR